MDYFALFSLPVSLKVEPSKVLTKYYTLCQQFHPDRMPPEQEAEAMRMTAEINRAKTILEQPMQRLAYLLEQQGLLPEGEKVPLPPDFLMEMMELNETIMDARMDGNAEAMQALERTIDAMEAQFKQPVAHFFEQAELQANEADWQALKLFYFQHKYIQRLKQQAPEM